MKKLAIALVALTTGLTAPLANANLQDAQLTHKPNKLQHFKRRLVVDDAFQRKLRSRYVDETFKIYVLLPENYDPHRENGYPVSYVLDGDYFVHALDHAIEFNTMVPDTVIVGVGYVGADPDGTKRIRDYSPTYVSDFPNSGGADNFRAMLENELMPRVNRHINVDQEQETLVSWSLSGLFALDTMFNHQSMFDNYIVASPYLEWDEFMIFGEEANYANANTDLDTKLFLSVGELEAQETVKSPYEALLGLLSSRNYPNLLLEGRIIEGEAHNTMVAPSFNKGIRHVLSDTKAIVLPQDTLAQYTGTYDFFPGVSMSIEIKGDLLVAQLSGNNGFEMYPQQLDEFFSKMIPGLSVSFIRDENSEVTQIIYDSPTLGRFPGTKR